MNPNLQEVALRVRALREDMGIPVEEMAEATGRDVQEYIAQESGGQDLSFTFLYKCAEHLGVDMTELLTGESPHLAHWALSRKGVGVSVKRRAGFEYLLKATSLTHRLAEPMVVTVPYDEAALEQPIHLSNHEDQEIEFVISGKMRFSYEGHEEDLEAGDLIMFDATRGHGMIAIGGEPLVFLAIVIKDPFDALGEQLIGE